MSRGIVVLAHGSREPETSKTMETIVGKVKGLTGNDKIAMAFFQFAAPSLMDAVRSFAEEGVSEICIIPYFLFSGVHVREDIPEAVAQIKEEYPGITVHVSETLGADDRLAQIVADRVAAL